MQVPDLCHDLLALGLLQLPREGCYFAYLALCRDCDFVMSVHWGVEGGNVLLAICDRYFRW